MGIILALVAFFLCVIIYVRMVRRETPEPLGKIKAAIPVVVGLAAPFLATALVILFGWLMKVTIGIPLAGLSDSSVLMSVCKLIGEDHQLHKERLQHRREDENNQLKEKHPGENQ